MEGIVETVLTILYLGLIIDALLSSGRELVRKHMVFQGKLLFLIAVLLIYYRQFSFGIPFWDAVVANPAKNAMDLLNHFIVTLSGGALSIAPPDGYKIFFRILIPASFVYYFTEQWFLYAFLDRRISRLVAFFALFLFISQGFNLGWISALTVPVFFPIFGGAILEQFVFSVPIPYMEEFTANIVRKLNLSIPGDAGIVIALIFVAVILYVLFWAIYHFILLAKGRGEYIAAGILILLLFLDIFAMTVLGLGVGSLPSTPGGLILLMAEFLLIVVFLGIVGDLLAYLSMLLFSRLLQATLREI